jgi:DNA mismatch repair protein MutS2
MNISDIKSKLDFDKIINKIKHYCFSELGLSKCDEEIFITDKLELNEVLKKVLEAKEFIGAEGGFELDGLHDIRKNLELSRISGAFIPADKLILVYNFLKISRITKSTIKIRNSESTGRYDLLSELAGELFEDKILEHNISITVDENGNVKDSASSKLRQIRNEIVKKSELLRKTLSKILKGVSEQELVRDDIISLRDGRLVIPVKVENKRKVPGIIHSSSAAGITVFIEPAETIEINNEITELYFEERREIEKILKEITTEVSFRYNELKNNCGILAELDFIQAKAKYAMEISAAVPEFSSESIKLISAFHPILLVNTGREKTVPLTFELSNDCNSVVITGPNAGGKTVTLKTIGLMQLMIQSGIPIPVAQESVMRIFDDIYLSIGDEQSIVNNLSSFSSHLQYLKEITDKAGANSLVLIDEICSGTDPRFGSPLAKAILNELSDRNTVTVVTTHIGDLKTFAYENKKFINASLEFDSEILEPNYRFIEGIPGQSFTFEIARKYKLPSSIIKYAESLTGIDETRLEELIMELTATRQKYTELKNEYDINNSRLKELIRQYDKRQTEFKENERKLLRESKEKAESILRDANRLIEQTIKEIREADKLKPAEIKEKFSKSAGKITEPIEKKIEKQETFKIGDAVKIKESNSAGIIVEFDKDNVRIDINGLIMKSTISKIEKTNKGDVKDTNSGISNVEINTRDYIDSIDIRGVFPYEVEKLIEDFIYEVSSYGVNTIHIIHGKGKGALREEVRRFLKKSPLVNSFRAGNWNEGDSGITIVELK